MITLRTTAVTAVLALATSACGSAGDGAVPGQRGDQPTAGAPSATDGAPESSDDDGSASSPPTTDAAGPVASRGSAGSAYVIARSSTHTGVVEVDVGTGEIRRTVSDGVGEGADSLDLVPATGTLVWSRTVTAARSEIVEVPVTGGEVEVVDRGYAVDVSDDGAMRVVARRVMPEGGGEHVEVEVTRDGTTVGRWTAGEDERRTVRPGNFAFSNDGTRLAYDVRFEDGVGLYVLDLDEAPTSGDLIEASRRLDVGDDEGAMNSRPFWMEDGAFGFVQGCCELPSFDTWDVVLYDLDQRAITRTLFTRDRGITDLDVDSSGGRLLFTVGHDAFGARTDHAGPPTLEVWHGGEPREVAAELRSPAW